MIAGTRTPAWASPDLDDSGWQTLSLAPVAGSLDASDNFLGYVPGWEANGHSGYWGYAWYRIRVNVATARGDRLALEGPTYVDDGYQLFDNGVLRGSFGKFNNASEFPTVYSERPQMFLLPDEPGKGSGNGDPTVHVLAFRVWMGPTSLGPVGGGFHVAPILGEAAAVEAHYLLDWQTKIQTYAFQALMPLLYLLLAIGGCCIALFDREDPVYWWISGVFVVMIFGSGQSTLSGWTQAESLPANYIGTFIIFWPLWLFGWVTVWWVWFKLRQPVWIPRVIPGVILLYMVSNALAWPLFFRGVERSKLLIEASYGVSLCIRLLALALMLFIVLRGVKTQGREGWLVLPAIALTVLATFSDETSRLPLPVFWFVHGVRILLVEATNLICVAIMFALMMRRLMLSMRRQRAMALDVKQAQEVQRVLLPEAPVVPGFVIETEYRPAREVGGDFFQIIPHPTDQSMLVVAGDVTGKGLQAGMLVAVLVGGIRSAAEYSFEPRAMLESLNRRLLGREGAFATCIAMQIAAEGSVTLANAGHLAPYLNGVEVPMEGALPLGLMDGAEFPVSTFEFASGDSLLLISDGVLEAQDKSGHLFGFERIRELLGSKTNASGLAAAAQAFGQEDDISVVSIIRA